MSGVTLPPQILLRIAALPKAAIADVLSIIADIFEAQKSAVAANVEAQTTANEPQKTQFEPQNIRVAANVEPQKSASEPQNNPQKPQVEAVEAQNPSFAGDILSSLPILPSLPREVSKSGKEEETPIIVKPSTRMPGAREGFDEFWKAYPKRINKLEATRKYEVALKKGARKEAICGAAKAYAKETQNTERKFIKAPDVWLHKGCYEDEDSPEASAGPATNGHRGPITALNRPSMREHILEAEREAQEAEEKLRQFDLRIAERKAANE